MKTLHRTWGGMWHSHGCLLGNLYLDFEARGKHQAMGRFGGGWDWALGLQWSKRTCLVRLLVATLHIECCTEERKRKLQDRFRDQG